MCLPMRPHGCGHFSERLATGRKKSRVHVSGSSDDRRITLRGELDLADKKALSALFDSVDRTAHVVLDLSDVTYMDSTILGCLVHLRKRLAEHGGDLRLFGVNPNILRLLTVAGLDRVFDIAEIGD